MLLRMHVTRTPATRAGKVFTGLCVVLLFAAAGVFGAQTLLSGQESKPGSGDESTRPIRVGVASPQTRDIEDAVMAIGTLMPLRSVELVPNAPGRVTKLPVSSGHQVSEGDLLIQLDDRAARAALMEAEATLSEARQNFLRVEQLADSNAAAEAQLEQARAAFRRAEAALMVAQADFEDRAITAPFAGTLGVIDTEEGAFLNASEPVTQLSDLSVVVVSFPLPERYYDSVVPGQILLVTTPAYPDDTFQGRVTLRAPGVDLGTRSFEVRAEVDNPDRRLVGGMFANSRLVLDTYEGLAVPDDAIISEGLTSYVYTVTNATAARTRIETGRSLGALTEVRSGLNTDDQVVITGWDQLSDGARVQIADDIAREGLE